MARSTTFRSYADTIAAATMAGLSTDAYAVLHVAALHDAPESWVLWVY